MGIEVHLAAKCYTVILINIYIYTHYMGGDHHAWTGNAYEPTWKTFFFPSALVKATARSQLHTLLSVASHFDGVNINPTIKKSLFFLMGTQIARVTLVVVPTFWWKEHFVLWLAGYALLGWHLACGSCSKGALTVRKDLSAKLDVGACVPTTHGP